MADETTGSGTNTQTTETTSTETQNTTETQTTNTTEAGAKPTGGTGEGGTEQQGTTTKTDDGSSTSTAAEVPEAYTLTAPEGQTLDQAGIELFTPIFKEAKLSNDLANKLVGTYASYQATLLQKQSEAWLEAAKADKEFGGEKFDETLKAVQAAFAKFGSPELKQFIEATGLGNHPELIRAFAKIGAASREDAPASGTPAGQQPKTMAQILFPDQN